MPVLTMTALIAGTLAVYQVAAPANAPKPAADPLTSTLIEGDNLRDMYKRLRSEGRDEVWATGTEAAVRNRFARIPNLVSKAGTVRVICGRTLCEVAAPMSAKLSDLQNQKLMEDLQGQSLNDDLGSIGLKQWGAGFSASYVSYWRRIIPSEKL